MKRVYPRQSAVRECSECLSADVPQEATRCMHCCAEIGQDLKGGAGDGADVDVRPATVSRPLGAGTGPPASVV